MISIIDYGVANTGALLNMLRKLGVEAQLVSEADAVLDSGKLILPGVGSFDNGMKHLSVRGLVDPIRVAANENRTPILGICLGMQLLGTSSEEGDEEGLKLIDAQSVRIPLTPGFRVPHMGWNRPVLRKEGSLLLPEVTERTRYYFTHSFHLQCQDNADVAAVAEYGIPLTAIVEKGNVMGVQFHPEKSHRFGMALLDRFSSI